MRESDDKAAWRARVYVDTRAGALKEAGDIVQPLANGTIDEDDIVADLFELTRGQQTGRLPGDATTITLFKSVGAALEDLAAAELAVGASDVRRGSISGSTRAAVQGLDVGRRVDPGLGQHGARIGAHAAAPSCGSRAACGSSASAARPSCISPSLGCGYFLKSWRQTRCGSSNRSAGLDTGALGICALVEQLRPIRPWSSAGASASTMAYMSLICMRAGVEGRVARVLQHLGPADDLEEVAPVLVVVGQDRHPAVQGAVGLAGARPAGACSRPRPRR